MRGSGATPRRCETEFFSPLELRCKSTYPYLDGYLQNTALRCRTPPAENSVAHPLRMLGRLRLYGFESICQRRMMNTRWRGLASPILFCALTIRLWAGGSGLNVVVVVNQNSTNSVQLGNYYCEKRRVPPQNYLRINWPGGNTEWTNSDFQNYLYVPLVSLDR